MTQPADGPWFRGTLAAHLAVFAVAAPLAWHGRGVGWIVPPIVLPVTLLAGLVLLPASSTRSTGLRIAGATLLAAVLEVALFVALFFTYVTVNPEWELS